MLDRICKALLIALALVSYAIWIPVTPAASGPYAFGSGNLSTAAVVEAGRSPSSDGAGTSEVNQ